MDCSLPGSSVHGILQARILDWVAFPYPRDFPNPGIEPKSPTLHADSTVWAKARNNKVGMEYATIFIRKKKKHIHTEAKIENR